MRTLPLVLLLGLPVIAAAQSADRTRTWEAGFKIMDMSHEFVAGENGSSLDIAGELGFGGFVGYNFNEHFQIVGEIAWSDPDYVASFPLDAPGNAVVTVDAELDIWFTNFKAVFNLLDRSVTPYFEIGYGWTIVDSNIQDGPADTGCWWDPWWGYMCASFYDTYESTLTSIMGTVGVRWDMNRDTVLKVGWGVRETDTDRAGKIRQDVLTAEFAWRF